MMKFTEVLIDSLFLLFLVLGLLTFGTLQAAQAADKEPPDKLVFESKLGNVTFDHAKHVEREKNDCTTCHPKLFPQAREPLNYKAGMHRPAEAKKQSCAGCHVEGEKSFASKGNCNTCHVKK